MKKLLSVALSLIMLFSAFSTISVFASDATVQTGVVSNDVTSVEALALKDFYPADFNENFFKIVKFTDGHSVENKLWALEISSDVDVSLKVAQYYYLSEYCNKPNDVYGQAFDTITVSKGETTQQKLWSASNVLFQNGYGFSLGLILDNSSLDDDANVTVNLVTYDMKLDDAEEDYVWDESTKQTFGTAELNFYGPVKFDDSALAGFADVLTGMKYGKNPTSDTLVEAVNAAMASENLDAAKTALKEKLNDDEAEKLGSILDEAETVVNSTKFNGYEVAIPYADIADTVEAKTYYPVVKDGIDYKEKDGEVSYSLDIEIGVEGETETITNPLVQQKVIIELPVVEGWDTTKTVNVYHGDAVSDETKIASGVAIKNNKVEFFTDSFSNFTVVGTELVIDESTTTRTDKVQLVVEQHEDNKNMFDLVLTPVQPVTGEAGAIINYAAGDYYVYFLNSINGTEIDAPAMKTIAYELTEVEGITITNEVPVEKDNIIGGFTFEAHGQEGNLLSAPAGVGIKLATLEVKGTGNVRIGTRGINTTIDTNADDYGEDNYIYMEKEDNDDTKARLDKWDVDTYFSIPMKTFDLGITVDFILGLENVDDASRKTADYIGVGIELKNEITGDVYNVQVGEGTEEDVTYLPVTYGEEEAKAEGSITLPANTTYTYKVSGVGFRTFRGSVYLDEAKDLHICNNARETSKQEVVKGDASTEKFVTFLVGDIYEDGIVDIYDLSAVTSYYAPGEAITEDKYVTYDLNRDGYIDVTDIAYVQISYGN